MTQLPHVLVAPDSFKGTFSAAEVAETVAKGVRTAGATADALPLGDGGEGTMAVLLATLGGHAVATGTTDPLGRPIVAEYGVLPGGRAVVEVAQASGLGLVEAAERDAYLATSYGTGQLIRAALEAGARDVVIATGGSATSDGGAGLVEALGPLPAGTRLTVLCDVTVPWERSAAVFAPQKGADPATVARIAARLDDLATRLPRDPRGRPFTGCAGGISGALWSRYDARLVPGAPFVLDTVGFDDHLWQASVVVTGEGRLDAQTFEGKVVSEVVRRSRLGGRPCVAVVGTTAIDRDEATSRGLQDVHVASTLEEIEQAGATIARSPW